MTKVPQEWFFANVAQKYSKTYTLHGSMNRIKSATSLDTVIPFVHVILFVVQNMKKKHRRTFVEKTLFHRPNARGKNNFSEDLCVVKLSVIEGIPLGVFFTNIRCLLEYQSACGTVDIFQEMYMSLWWRDSLQDVGRVKTFEHWILTIRGRSASEDFDWFLHIQS